jgi:hypothetical protein
LAIKEFNAHACSWFLEGYGPEELGDVAAHLRRAASEYESFKEGLRNCSHGHGDCKANIKASNKCASPSCGIESVSMKLCSKCKDVYYCGRDCQVAHWPDHKARCKAISKSQGGGHGCKTVMRRVWKTYIHQINNEYKSSVLPFDQPSSNAITIASSTVTIFGIGCACTRPIRTICDPFPHS